VVLVTGSAGLLGANLVSVLQSSGQIVSGFHRKACFAPRDLITLQVDLTERNSVEETVSRVRPDWIVHCAAATNVDWCEVHSDSAKKDNVEASRNVARAAKLTGARLIYISSDAIYGEKDSPHLETDVPDPLTVYAQTKLQGENAVREESESALIVRTNIFGWNAQNKSSLAEWILFRLRRHEEVGGFVDVTFNPLLANDVADILAAMMEQRCSGVYNLASAEACSKYEFAIRIAQVFGLDEKLVRRSYLRDARLAAPRARNAVLDTTRLASLLGRPLPRLEEGLLRFKELEDSGFVKTLKGNIREVC